MEDAPVMIFDELRRVAAAVAGGDLAARARLDGLDDEARLVAGDINRMLDAVRSPLDTATGALHSLAEGRIPEFVVADYPGEFNRVKRDTNLCVAMLVGVLREVEELVESAKAGRLSARGNDWDFTGCWQDLLTRLNGMVDAFIAPFQVASRYMEMISQGLIPDRIEERYPGELNRIRRNLNTVAATLNGLLGDVNRLCAAAMEGRLDERARADRYGNEFRRIVEGINGTLDAVTTPMHASARILNQVARGDLTVRVEGAFSGEFARLQDDINSMVERLRASMAEIRARAVDLASASEELAAVGAGLAENADRTLAQASAASESSRQMADGMRALSAGTGETRRSIEEIAGNIGEVSRETQAADDGARRTLQNVSRLARASEDIGEVIKLIGGIAGRSNTLASGARDQAAAAEGASRGFGVVADEVKRLADLISDAAARLGEKTGGAESREIARGIAEIARIAWQTKLLSINAALESARAGESGRQFSLVAGEIGELAGQTSRAAGDIGVKLEAIGSAGREGAEAVESISQTTGSLRRAAEQIAGEVRRRVETTNEMAALADAAVEKSAGIVENATAVAHAATATSAAVRQTDREARRVAETAERLRQLVNGFVV